MAEIDRHNEPVTFGVPLGKGVLNDVEGTELKDPAGRCYPVQCQVVKRWSDDSVKWLLVDAQISVKSGEKKELLLLPLSAASSLQTNIITIQETEEELCVDTKAAAFYFSKKEFKPFNRIIFANKNIIQSTESNTVLADSDGKLNVAMIENYHVESFGGLRCSIRFDGFFGPSDQAQQKLRFISRVHLFANLSIAKIEFTVWNPASAQHPGGLWDLGDPSSFFFSGLSINFRFKEKNRQMGLVLFDEELKSSITIGQSSSISEKPLTRIKIYQDSSGGRNWQSPNHVNQFGEVRTSFRGYRIYKDDIIAQEGDRIQPTAYIDIEDSRISVTTEHFWQNFPSSCEVHDGALTIGLFPEEFDDVFELQPGEQKTHNFYLNVDNARDSQDVGDLNWVHYPLLPHCGSEWYASTGIFPLFKHISIPEHKQILKYIDKAVQGDSTFMMRREVIDEFGWRNFGDLYADHEAIYQETETPFISHYNNQYDGLLGILFQFVRTGGWDWFSLGDQLCRHVRDIDIYHTSSDRSDFNHGLFWHTEHHLAAETATHRCFSKRHEGDRNLKYYGGAPALAHNYTTGLSLHYYLTGQRQSYDAAVELAKFVESSKVLNNTLADFFFSTLKRIRARIKNRGKLVDLSRVYGFDGPGRGSGNSLNSLLDAFELTGQKRYLDIAEDIVLQCIHPDDDIEKRNLLDRENRWMYTIFLKSLCRYLDVKTECCELDDRFGYARESLVKYARWMVRYEDLYLNDRSKLEFPNETWAAQEFRKADVLQAAAVYVESSEKQVFLEKAQFFLKGGVEGLREFGDKALLTRPMILMMTNGWKKKGLGYEGAYSSNLSKEDVKRKKCDGMTINVGNELDYLKNILSKRI